MSRYQKYQGPYTKVKSEKLTVSTNTTLDLTRFEFIDFISFYNDSTYDLTLKVKERLGTYQDIIIPPSTSLSLQVDINEIQIITNSSITFYYVILGY